MIAKCESSSFNETREVQTMIRKTYKLLMILQGFLWFYMAIQNAFSDKVMLPILVLTLLNGVLYILFGLTDIRKLFFQLAAFAFLFVNIILTFTDQLGFYDYLVMGWNFILLILVFSIIFKRQKA
jgi:hypothetical protein